MRAYFTSKKPEKFCQDETKVAQRMWVFYGQVG